MPITLTRSFETESDDTPELAIGARYAEVGNWQEAAEVWKSGVSKAPTEDAGYLTYNIAVAYEVLGDFDNALKWAERSYVEFQNDDALRYVNILRDRIADEEQVRMQLDSP
jgi:tetratricopeptide (TPR) repeat protein